MTLSPLSTALGALLETGLNQLLSLDPRSRERSKALYGKVLKLEFARYSRNLADVFTPSG